MDVHMEIVKFQALTFQALLPALYFYAVFSYALGQFGIYNHPFLEYSTFIVVGMTIFNEFIGLRISSLYQSHWISILHSSIQPMGTTLSSS